MRTRSLMETTPTGASVAVHPDVDSVAIAAATVILEEARGAVKEKGRFTIALAGGSTSKPVFRLLASPPFSELMPWDAMEIFWGDERCVDVTDPRSNERTAREALLDHVPVSPERVHPMRCAGGAGGAAGGGGAAAGGEAAAQRAADAYEAVLRSIFAPGDGIDLIMLGVGANGHTASLFPGSAALDEREHWAIAALEDPTTAAAVSGSGEQLWRLSLTAPFINRAALVLFVVTGAAKAPVVSGALRGDGDPREWPVLLIRPAPGRELWLLDDDAASQFRPPPHPRVSGPCAAPGQSVESYEDLPDCEGGPSR